MIDVRCTCGEVYHAQEAQAGCRIRCRCGAILLVQQQTPISKSSPVEVERAYHSYTISESDARAAQEVRWGRIGGAVAVAVMGIVVMWFWGRTSSSPSAGQGQRPIQPIPLESIPKPLPYLVPRPACAHGQPAERLETGERIQSDDGTDGHSQLSVVNNSNSDVVVSLVRRSTGDAARAVYIRAQTSYVLRALEPDTYLVRWESGAEWITACLDFISDADYAQLDTPFVVQEREDYRTVGKAILNPIPNGNTRRRQISRKLFLEGLRRAKGTV